MQTIVTIPAKKYADEIPAGHEVNTLISGDKVWIILDVKQVGPFAERFRVNWVEKPKLQEYCKISKSCTKTKDLLETIFLYRYYYNCSKNRS
jgi:hypothetical protein